MRVDTLEGALLDYWVAKADSLPIRWEFNANEAGGERGRLFYDFDNPVYRFKVFSPSTDWSQGGPIIERERINVLQWSQPDGMWRAAYGVDFTKAMPGMTYLSAAMRCYVASKFGEEVPDQENP